MTDQARGSIGVVLVLALLVASVPVCPCVPDALEPDHACCAPSLAISAGHGDCCPPAPELTGSPTDSPASARLADSGPAPESIRLAAERPSGSATAPAPSPPSILRI
jgi:hypothetical protein